jgi:hypothetical protein
LHVSLCTSSWICVEKRQKEEEKDEIPLENVIERKHSALHPNVTKITLESFLAWKKRKRQEKIDKLEQDMERRKADFKAGKALVVCTKLTQIDCSLYLLNCA